MGKGGHSSGSRAQGILAAITLAAAITVLIPVNASAAGTITVTTSADAGPGSLREAIDSANAATGVDTIDFSSAMTIDLESPLPAITESVLIDGTLAGSCGSGARGVSLSGALGVGVGIDLASGSSIVRGLALDDFNQAAVQVRSSSSGNTIECSAIGIGSTPATQSNGVLIQGSSSNVIDGNVISGSAAGVQLVSASASGNVITGNSFGTDAAGAQGPTNMVGVSIAGATNTTVAGNRVVGAPFGDNSAFGVSGDGGTGLAVDGNRFGTDATGAAAVGALTQAVAINGTTGAVVSDNTFAGTTDAALFIANTSGAIVVGNSIGLGTSGDALPNRMGINLSNAPATSIGGPGADDGNVIAASTELGMNLSGASDGTVIEGNRIGTDATGTLDRGNGVDGIQVLSTMSIAIKRNVIAFNGQNGISIYGSGTTATVSANSFFDNDRLAYDIANDGQVNPNDPLDADTGPNGHQNFPVITAVASGSSTGVTGTLSSAPGGTYHIEVFAQSTCDAPYGHGEAKRYLGATTATTDATGHATFTLAGAASAAGEQITATATDAAGNTSELSACAQAAPPEPSTYVWTGFYRPIDNPDVVNIGRAGRTYPVKWSLTSGGDEVSTLSAITSIRHQKVSCATFAGDPIDLIETTTSGSTSLRYDAAAHQYVYNWDTPTTPGCYRLIVTLGDGSSHEAHFDLR